MRRADNLCHLHVPIVLKSGSLNLLEPSGPVQACNETVYLYLLLQVLCCATNRNVAGSIPAGVSEFFIDLKSFRSHYGPAIDSASNRNEYQEYFLGVKAAGE